MWNTFGSDAVPYAKIGDFILRGSIATSGDCCRAMEQYFSIEPRFNNLMFETLAFYMSIALSELMTKQAGATQKLYSRFEQAIEKAIGDAGASNQDFLPFSMMPLAERFPDFTLCYFQGRPEGFRISRLNLEAYADIHGFRVPKEDGSPMSGLIYILRAAKTLNLHSLESQNVEKLAVAKLTDVITGNVSVFVEQLRKVLR